MSTSKKFEFTSKKIAALSAHDQASPSREAEFTDASCTGLHLRVSKNGRRFFQHRYKFLGRKVCVNLGEFPAVTVEAARQRVLENKATLARGKDPATESRKGKADLTFDQFSTQYLEYAKQRKKSWQDDKYRIDRNLVPALGKLRLSAITHRDVVMLHAKENERTSSTNANHLMALLRAMLNLAIKFEYLEKNPCDGVSKFNEGPLRERYLSRDELPRFLQALAEEDDTLSKAAILLLLVTGCRRNEILSMKWSQVRLEEGRIYLPVTKNGRSRTVHLNDKAFQILQELERRRNEEERTRTSQYVFPSRKGTKKGYLFDLRKPLQRACTIAGIDNFRTHDLRHTYASLAVSSGADLYAVQRLLGHSDISMTQRYSHLSAGDLQTATQGVATLLGECSNF